MRNPGSAAFSSHFLPLCSPTLTFMHLCSFLLHLQHFFSFFKTLTGKNVTVELKNELVLRGKLYSVDQYLNIKLTNMTVAEPEKHPHLVCPPLLLSHTFCTSDHRSEYSPMHLLSCITCTCFLCCFYVSFMLQHPSYHHYPCIHSSHPSYFSSVAFLFPRPSAFQVAVNNIFIRGSVVRYIMLDPQDVEVNLIQDACRRAHHASKASA